MFPVVIIAAGLATRLKPYSEEVPKCFMELEHGVTILDFIMDRINDIKAEYVLIVTRPQYRENFENKLKGKVKIIETDAENFGNLYSVNLALRKLRGNFIILMSDHIFEQSMLNNIVSYKSDKAFTICLDRKPTRRDAIEGLKLALKNGKIVHASKDILPIHGIDTGIIFCRKNARKYIKEAIKKFGISATIADALSLAAAEGEVDYIDITGKLWKDIDTPNDLIDARKIYWKILRKNLFKPSDGLISRYLNRPISTRISLCLYKKKIKINPLTITLTSFILALLAALLLALRKNIFGGLLVQAASIIDGVDGEVARLYRTTSRSGAYIDSLLDRIADIAIVIGLALILIDSKTLIFVILATANVILVSYATHNLRDLNIAIDKLRTIPVTRDVRLFIVSIMSIIGHLDFALFYLAIFPIFYIVYSIFLVFKSEKSSLDELMKNMKIKEGPKPDIIISKREVVLEVEKLISNTIKLGLSLFLISMVSPAFSDIALINLYEFTLTSNHIILALNTILIIYFGYNIIIPLRNIIDLVARRLVGVFKITETALKRILGDLLYIALIILLWIYLPPYLVYIPYIGDYLSRIIILVLFLFFILIFYDFSRTMYLAFKDFYDEIVKKIADKLHEE